MTDGLGFLKGIFSAEDGNGASTTDTSDLRIRLVQGALSHNTAQLALQCSLGLDVSALWRGGYTLQPTAQAWWKALAYWTMANSMLYGSCGLEADRRYLPTSIYGFCKNLIDEAERLSDAALRCQVLCDDGKDQPVSSIFLMPSFPVNQGTYEGVWAVLYELCNLIDTHLEQLRPAPKPSRFKEVQDRLEELTLNAQAMVHQYQIEWVRAESVREKLVVVEKTLPYMRELFAAIQQWWAPALLGKTYIRSLRNPVRLDDLIIAFSPWTLTDPWQRAVRKRDDYSSDELAAFWATFRDPGLAWRLQQELDQANRRGDIRRHGAYPKSAPWPSRYLVRWPVTLGSIDFVPGDLVCLYFNSRATRPPVEIRGDGHFDSLIDLYSLRN